MTKVHTSQAHYPAVVLESSHNVNMCEMSLDQLITAFHLCGRLAQWVSSGSNNHIMQIHRIIKSLEVHRGGWIVPTCVVRINNMNKLGLRCSTGGPEHPHVGACCGRGRERSMTCVAVHGINFTSHWTFDVNGTEVVKQSLLPVASRWHHQYCYLQTNISVQVGALM